MLLNGRRCIALVDSGASQSYVSPELATLAELNCVPSVLHLELADGSKIQATEQAQGVVCNIGETSVLYEFYSDETVECCGLCTGNGLAAEVESSDRLEEAKSCICM